MSPRPLQLIFDLQPNSFLYVKYHFASLDTIEPETMVDEAGPSNSLSTLHLHPNISRSTGPLLVCVLDGWGESTHEDDYNAIHVANTPNMDALKETGEKLPLTGRAVHFLF